MTTKKPDRSEGVEYFDYIYPKISIIIPTFNSSQKIANTLNFILHESYPDYEVIIVDAGSTDKTLEIVNSFYDPKIRICSVTTYQVYEMLNKGISLSTGEYLNFLRPGDNYLSINTIKTIMDLAVDHDKPHIAYGASLLRDGKSEPQVYYRELSACNLKKGLQPASLESIWFHKDVFRVIGKFKTHFKLRSELDLLCRFVLSPGLQHVSTSHVLIDFDLRMLNLRYVTTHFKETWEIVHDHFGLPAALRWLFYQQDIGRMIRLWMRSLRQAFFGA